MTNTPEFDFEVPEGYTWLIERKLVGFEPGGPLQPWHYYPAQNIFEPTKRWPAAGEHGRLVAFAKRQDSDDLACFEVAGNKVSQIVLVHGWTPQGYEIVDHYADFWMWLKTVIDDMAEWVSLSADD